MFDGGHAGTGLSIARGPGRGPRPAARPRTDRRRGRRRGPDERPVARGPQRHRPAQDADADRGQRQRDVDQPDGRRLLQVPLADQAVADVAAGQERLRPGRRANSRRGRHGPRAQPAAPPLRRPVRAARAAVRGSRHHLHRPGPGPRPARPARDARARAGAARTHDRPRPDPEGPRVPAGRDRPGRLPRRGAPAVSRWPRVPTPTTARGRPCRPSRWRTTPRRRPVAAAAPKTPELHGGLRRRADRARPDRPADRGDHRRDADRDRDGQVPGGSTRTGSSTSGSPSSTR